MEKKKSGSNPILRMILCLLIVCFAGSSLADNGESLLTQAKNINKRNHSKIRGKLVPEEGIEPTPLFPGTGF